jgi:CBS domain-containing protein
VKVSEIMSRARVTDSESDALIAAAGRMWKEQTGSLLVMSDGRLLGIITERDVMKAVARGLDLATTPVSAVMTTSVLTVTPSTAVSEAARHMSERWIRHLPVVDDGQVVGMVSQRDLCGVLAEIAPDAEPSPEAVSHGDLVRDRRLARVDPQS